MRTIQKSSEPASLDRYRRDGGRAWDDYDDKAGAFELLCEEQGYLCAYCMQRISPRHWRQERAHVEHWISQTRHPESPFDESTHLANQTVWENLLGVCHGGHGQRRREQHCDTRRRNKPLRIHPASGSRGQIEDLFRFKGDGRIDSKDPDALHDIKHLNLNGGRLPENRASVIDHLMSQLPTRSEWTIPVLQRHLNEWQSRCAKIRANGSRRRAGYREYNLVAIQFLKKQLKKRRSSGS